MQIRKNLGILRKKNPQNFEVKTGVVINIIISRISIPTTRPVKV